LKPENFAPITKLRRARELGDNFNVWEEGGKGREGGREGREGKEKSKEGGKRITGN
jgi:hypothetical protein